MVSRAERFDHGLVTSKKVVERWSLPALGEHLVDAAAINAIHYRRASKLSRALRDLPNSNRLTELKWTTLGTRRTRGDLIQWHKIQHENEPEFGISEDRRSRR